MYCGIRNVNSSILAFHDDTGCNHAAMVIAAYLQRGKSSSLARPYPAQTPARRSGPDLVRRTLILIYFRTSRKARSYSR